MWLLQLALHSLRNRLGTALLTMSTIAVSVSLLLGVHMVSTAARTSFENTLSGTDLVVGARTGSIDLLLASVFRIGDADVNVSWKTYQKIAHHRDVAWTISISWVTCIGAFVSSGPTATTSRTTVSMQADRSPSRKESRFRICSTQ